MKHIGIICEFNPIHQGHARLISCAREEGLVVCLMSGNFTQRGEAAVLPPVPRATMAIAAGADLVLELPFPYACASAAYFAGAGVEILAGWGWIRWPLAVRAAIFPAFQCWPKKKRPKRPRGARPVRPRPILQDWESLFFPMTFWHWPICARRGENWIFSR